jgi:hypothetical protein
MRFVAVFTAENLFSRDTIVVPAGTGAIVFYDHASSGLGNWGITPSGSWGIVIGDPNHPSRYFSESPTGNYTPSANSRFTLTPSLDLSGVVHAYALFEATWEFEENADFGAIEASSDGVSYTPLFSTGTTPGSGMGVQVAGLPYFAGSRRTWQPEMADLSPFTGAGQTEVRLRYRVRSDAALQFSGFAFDSLRVVIYDPTFQPTPVGVPGGPAPVSLELSLPRPNPTRGLTRFEMALPRAGSAQLEILDLQGRRVRTLLDGALGSGRYVHGWDLTRADGQVVSPGVYLVRLRGGGATVTRRIVVL